MPQMSPLPWLFLLIVSFLFVVLTICFVSYFNVHYSVKNELNFSEMGMMKVKIVW